MRSGFFIPAKVLAKKFKGKFMCQLQSYYQTNQLLFSDSCAKLRNPYEWVLLRDNLYQKQWCPNIKETFNGHGNAIEYLGRYTRRIAITNARVQKVTAARVTFTAKDYKNDCTKAVTLRNEEFIRRLMMHVLPSGFQKIRYYGFLNNRSKAKNLKIIFRIQGYQQFKKRFINVLMDEVLKIAWDYDIHTCRACGCANSMRHSGRTFNSRE